MASFERWAQFRHFRLAVAIADHGSILHAASALALSQPTASKLLQDLEGELRAPLFFRSNRGAEPTELGRTFIDHGRVILAQLGHTSQSLSALATGVEGRVILGTLLFASSYLLPRTIVRLREKRPKITLKIVEGTNDRLMPALIAGELDIVIGRLSEIRHRNDIDQEPLYSDELCVVARRAHPLAALSSVSLELLLKADWILPPDATTLRRNLESLFHGANLNAPAPTVESVCFLSNRYLLLESDLLGVWTRTLYRQSPDRDQLAMLKIENPPRSGVIGISRRRGTLLSPAAEAVIAELRITAEEVKHTGAADNAAEMEIAGRAP